MKIEEYADHIAKNKHIKFNGRVSNILSIDHFEGIAVAKLEIIIPSLNRRFIVLILLKKLESGWKTINKTTRSEISNRLGNKVLLILSNATYQGTSNLTVGNSFSEIVIVYHNYQKVGCHVDIISP